MYKTLTECIQMTKLHEEFGQMMKRMLRRMLDQHAVKTEFIAARVKRAEDLTKKAEIKREEGQPYLHIRAVPDVVGIRIILYFRSDIDTASKVLEKEFRVIEKLDVEKHYPTQHKSIGYRAVHMVVTLNEDRLKMSEYLKFAGMRCEVQVTTVLEHAWAEVEHDLLYKERGKLAEDEIRIMEREFAEIADHIRRADEAIDRLERQHQFRNRRFAPKWMEHIKRRLLSR